ncbi:MAG: GAF domain-containing protein [Chloroflexales bacterium]
MVEDEKIVAQDIQAILERSGYRVPAIAVSGEQAIAHAAQHHPDLVLMDIALQGEIDGIQAASQINQRYDIPIIYLTAYGGNAIADRVKASEPIAYILKPYEERSLLMTIEIALHQYRQSQRRIAEALQQSAENLRVSEEMLRLVMETIDDVFWMSTPGVTKILYVSPTYEKLWQMPADALFASPRSFLSIIHPDDLDSVLQIYKLYHAHGKAYECEYRIQPADGSLHWIRERGYPIYDGAGGVHLMTGNCTDITARKQAEDALSKLNRAVLMINQCNQILVRSDDEDKLLKEMCETIVKVGGYRMAWVGFSEHNQERLVRPAAQFGFEEGYLEQARISWGDNDRGRGPTGTAIRGGLVQVNQNFLNNPAMALWRESALQRGYQSSIALPLKNEGRVFGALTIYSSVPYAFDHEEVALLNDLAGDLSYGIEALRRRLELKCAEVQIRLQKERAEALAEISQALSETIDYGQAIDLIAWRVAALIGDLCVVLILSGDGQYLSVTAAHNCDPEAAQFARSLLLSAPYPLAEGLAGHVVQTGEALLIPDAQIAHLRGLVNPIMHTYLDRVGLYGVLIVPLKAEGNILGALSVTRDRPGRAYTPDDQTFLQNIAHRAAQAIINMRLYRDAQRRAQNLEALRAIDTAITSSLDLRRMLSVVVHHVVAELSIDAAAVLLLDPHTQTLIYAAGHGFRGEAIERLHLRLGEGYAGRAALERRVISKHNVGETEPDFAAATMPADEAFTCCHAAPLIIKDQVIGVLEVFTRVHRSKAEDWLAFFETLAQQTAIAVDSAQLFENLQRSNLELFRAYDDAIEGWSRAMDLRDKETEGHTQRVTGMTERLARAAGLSEAEIVHIRRGALLHDIGKMGVPDSILLKPDKLTDEEWVIMRKHPAYAYDMLEPIVYLRPALDIPYCHHEKWDGTGYPRGLKGEQIPLAARLFAVVDVWDALRFDRPYHRRWPEDKVLAHLRALAGTHFDPTAVKLFFEVISERA